MTDDEAIELIFERHFDAELYFAEYDRYPKGYDFDFDQAILVAAQALKEIRRYREIGTVEECREAVEKLPVAEEVIRKLLCSEYGSSCQFCIHDSDEDAMCCNVGGSGSWCCENAKWNGRLE